MKIDRIVNTDDTKKKWFERLVNNAYNNGWTYSSCTPEMWEDYVKRWNHFFEYLDYMKTEYNGDTLKILIGEAPPFYRATKECHDRAYFYSPYETGSSPWFSAPLANFVDDKNLEDKKAKLNALAKEGVLLLDIFPFPIIQDTEMRMDITGGFAEHLKEYFVTFVLSVLRYLDVQSKNTQVFWGIAATKYAGTQLMLGENSRRVLKEGFTDIFIKPIAEKNTGEITFKRTLKFHDVSEEVLTPCKDRLNLSVWSSSKKQKKVFSPYFVFVVTLLNANDWLTYVSEAKKLKLSVTSHDFAKKIVRENNNLNDFLIKLNEQLGGWSMLPIFSTASGGISFNEHAFFNSNEVLAPKKKPMKKKVRKKM